jgi:putative membrane protein
LPLVGGLLAAGAMSLVHRILADLIPAAATPATEQPEDSTVKVASAVTSLVGHRLADDHKALAGAAVHYAFGASVGAVYGGVAEIVPRVTAALGLPFGIAVWLGAHVIAVPALGLAAPPTRRLVAKEGEEFALHLVYGTATEVARRLLRR